MPFITLAIYQQFNDGPCKVPNLGISGLSDTKCWLLFLTRCFDAAVVVQLLVHLLHALMVDFRDLDLKSKFVL